MTKAARDQQLIDGLRQLQEKRLAAGVCRHCGGKVPCFSGFGDAAVGVRHTTRTMRKYFAQWRRDLVKGDR